MLNKALAREILPLVNDTEYYEMLVSYAKERIFMLHQDLETSNDIESVKKTQGAIQELKRIYHLQDEARADSK